MITTCGSEEVEKGIFKMVAILEIRSERLAIFDLVVFLDVYIKIYHVIQE